MHRVHSLCYIFGEGETGAYREKPLGAKKGTNKLIQPTREGREGKALDQRRSILAPAMY